MFERKSSTTLTGANFLYQSSSNFFNLILFIFMQKAHVEPRFRTTPKGSYSVWFKTVGATICVFTIFPLVKTVT